MAQRTTMYAVIDRRAELIIGGVILSKNEGAAIRTFTDGLEDPRSILNKHPADFDLIELGILDEESGAIAPVDGTPPIILAGSQWAALQRQALENQKQ